MVQSMVSVIVISLMVWANIPHMATLDPLGFIFNQEAVSQAMMGVCAFKTQGLGFGVYGVALGTLLGDLGIIRDVDYRDSGPPNNEEVYGSCNHVSFCQN